VYTEGAKPFAGAVQQFLSDGDVNETRMQVATTEVGPGGHGIFILDDADMPEAECLDQRLNDLVMWDGAVSCGCRWRRHEVERFPWNRSALIADECAGF
jgi:hypothetical protein